VLKIQTFNPLQSSPKPDISLKIHVNNTILFMYAEQKAERFADYLEQIFKPNEQQSRNEEQMFLSEENEDIPLVTPKEVANKIKCNINPRKAPGFDLITGEVLKQLPRKCFVKLTP
jgi:hypothetical protein